MLDAGKTSLMLLDEEAHELRVAAATGASLEPSEMDPVALGQGVAGVALALGEAVVVDDVDADDALRGRPVRERYRVGLVRRGAAARRERPLGVLCVTDRRTAGPSARTSSRCCGSSRSRSPAAGRRAQAAERPRRLRRAAARPRPRRHEVRADRPARRRRERRAEADAELARAICDAMTGEVEPERVLAARAAAGRARGCRPRRCRST